MVKDLLSPRIQFRQFAAQYLVGNLIAMVAAVAIASYVRGQTDSAVITAIAASVGATMVWYVYIALYYVRTSPFRQALRNITSDYGLAEVLDTILIRPVLIYVMAQIAGEVIGVAIASLSADAIYTLIVLYRQRRRVNA